MSQTKDTDDAEERRPGGPHAARDDAEDDPDDAEPDDDDSDAAEDEDEPRAARVAPRSAAQPARRDDAAEPPARARRMTKEDALGPRPPIATHWRCRRIDEGGQRTTLLYHDDGAGIASCEWLIRSCTPETIKQRWGAEGGSFVVQYVHTDERGQRRPCGRSRMLILSPRPRAEPADAPAFPLAPATPVLPAAFAPGADSFAQMFSMLAFMQDRDEKVRAAAREEARLANERYKADVELMMERDRLSSKERIAQIEATARAAGRAVPAGGLDTELLAQRIGEVVGSKLEEVYDSGDDDAPPPASPSGPPEWVGKLVEAFSPIVQTLLADKLADRGLGAGAAGGSNVTH